MSEPTTTEGRALLAQLHGWDESPDAITAIEAAAAEAERARIRARLEALPVMLMEDEERDMDMIVLGRHAVLAAIDGPITPEMQAEAEAALADDRAKRPDRADLPRYDGKTVKPKVGDILIPAEEAHLWRRIDATPDHDRHNVVANLNPVEDADDSRASAEGLRERVAAHRVDKPINSEGAFWNAGIDAALAAIDEFAALRDTGPRPDSGYRAEVHCCCCLDHCTRALSTPPTETSD